MLLLRIEVTAHTEVTVRTEATVRVREVIILTFPILHIVHTLRVAITALIRIHIVLMLIPIHLIPTHMPLTQM